MEPHRAVEEAEAKGIGHKAQGCLAASLPRCLADGISSPKVDSKQDAKSPSPAEDDEQDEGKLSEWWNSTPRCLCLPPKGMLPSPPEGGYRYHQINYFEKKSI